MTTRSERDGALAAVERIVNRGGDVVGETLAVLRGLYPSVELHESSFVLENATDDDRQLLDRVALLVSHFTRGNAQRFSGP